MHLSCSLGLGDVILWGSQTAEIGLYLPYYCSSPFGVPWCLLSYGSLCIWLPFVLAVLFACAIADWIDAFIISLLSWCTQLVSCALSLTFCAAPFFVSGYMGGRRIVAVFDVWIREIFGCCSLVVKYWQTLWKCTCHITLLCAMSFGA